MQRKNSILKTTHRSGMAMIMAITVLVVIATIMALSLGLTTKTSKRTTDLYLYEQATILSHSAAEYAILQATQQVLGPCRYTGISFSHNGTYDINVTMQYVAFAGRPCHTNALAINRLYATTTTLESDGTVLMDITITTNAGTEPIRYFRRSIQKL